MSTNYYIKHNICKCCGKYDKIHLGNTTALGRDFWNVFVFKFKTYYEDKNGEKKKMGSKKDWDNLFYKLGDNHIVDEYGKTNNGILLEVKTIKKVTYEMFWEKYKNKFKDDDYYFDKDGFLFKRWDFS